MDEFEMKGGERELSTKEAERFGRLDRAVTTWARRSGDLDLWLGRALWLIKRRELYRPGTWTAYCERRGMSRRNANRKIAYARTLSEWDPRVPRPGPERQVRPLVGLSWEDRHRVAWRVDRENSGRGFEGVTAERVEEVAREVSGGSKVVRAPRRGLVLVKGPRGIGPQPVEKTGILEDLDAIDAAARRIATRGEYALADALKALDAKEGEEAAAKINNAFFVLSPALAAFIEHWESVAPSSGQEPLSIAAARS